MSRVIVYVELYNYINVWNQADWFQVKYMKFNTDKNKPLCNEKRIGRYDYSYKQRDKWDMDKKQL